MLALLFALADLASLAGFYHSNQMEIGAAIELEADGKFEYALDYGAVSEVAEGTWTTDGRSVFLTATRMQGAYKVPNFDKQPLEVHGSTLILKRYGAIIRFELETSLPIPPNRNKKL